MAPDRDDRSEDEPRPAPGRASLILFCVVFYGALGGGGVLWFHWRGRMPAFFDLAMGAWPPWLAVLVGLATALLVHGGSALLARWWSVFSRLESEIRSLLGPLTSLEAWTVAVFSGVAEEIFFRGALQDVVGLWFTAALFAVTHTGRGRHFMAWTVSSFLIGLLLGWLVASGAGLFCVALAHAVINYLGLLRISVPRTDGDQPRAPAA